MQVHAAQDGLAQDEIEQAGVEGLDDEEEDFFDGDVEDLGAEDDVRRVGPDVVADQVAVPWDGGGDGDGDEEEDLVEVELGA